jgi:calcineurin-like phosphoesterase family protein
MPVPRMTGPNGQLYADPKPSPDETSFRQDNNSAAYYNSQYYLLHKNQVQPIPPARQGAAPNINLADYIPTNIADAIDQAGRITFHAVGDTGAAKVSRSQTAATAIAHEAGVADAMAAEVQSQGVNGPAFFFNLGDIIYNFGEGQYYYDQFYEPFRDYDRPIFAIPGNHDGMVFGSASSAPQVPTLAAFLTNFCAAEPGPSPDSGGLVRSVMTQPAVYFTLDAPYVSIIGLYSNVLDSGAGVISSQKGHFPLVDDQLTFLQNELKRLKPDRQAGKRAVLLAVHHPPLSADARHGGSSGELADIDACCTAAGLWPDAVLSGHAHLYQRFTRTIQGKETPYIVAGSGGFAATAPLGGLPNAPVKVGNYTLVVNPIVEFGYLTITTDAKTLTITFKTSVQKQVMQRDSVTVDLKSGTITSDVSGATPNPLPGPPRKAPTKGKGTSKPKSATRGKKK